MKLQIGKYTFDWTTQFFRSIEHRGGVLALTARHQSGEMEVLEAIATPDMHAAAQEFAEAARKHRDRPGVIVGFLTTEANRPEAIRIADGMLARQWLRPVETDGWTRDWRDIISCEDLAELPHESAIRALYGCLS